MEINLLDDKQYQLYIDYIEQWEAENPCVQLISLLHTEDGVFINGGLVVLPCDDCTW